MDINRYAILIVIEENWIMELDKNFMICSDLKKIYLKKDIIDLLKLQIRTKQNS